METYLIDNSKKLKKVSQLIEKYKSFKDRHDELQKSKMKQKLILALTNNHPNEVELSVVVKDLCHTLSLLNRHDEAMDYLQFAMDVYETKSNHITKELDQFYEDVLKES